MSDNNRNTWLSGIFDAGVAFWLPWSGKGEQQEVLARTQRSSASVERARQPINPGQEPTIEKTPKTPTKRARQPKPLAQKAPVEKKPKAAKRAQLSEPLTQEAIVEKKPIAPIKRSVNQEQELEREERAQKTERLRQLRLAKEAADQKDR